VDANARLSSLVPANQERLANVWLRAGTVLILDKLANEVIE
jgi:hypothetical protein